MTRPRPLPAHLVAAGEPPRGGARMTAGCGHRPADRRGHHRGRRHGTASFLIMVQGAFRRGIHRLRLRARARHGHPGDRRKRRRAARPSAVIGDSGGRPPSTPPSSPAIVAARGPRAGVARPGPGALAVQGPVLGVVAFLAIGLDLRALRRRQPRHADRRLGRRRGRDRPSRSGCPRSCRASSGARCYDLAAATRWWEPKELDGGRDPRGARHRRRLTRTPRRGGRTGRHAPLS